MADTMPYQDADRPVDERVADLVGRMTVQEKIAQMTQLDARRTSPDEVREKAIGSVLFLLGEQTNEWQRAAADTRLGVPLLIGIDAIHGHGFWPGATVFPSQLALSCAWDPDLVEAVGRVTARETRLTGVHWTFSPVCGIARDTRWGRVDETFGEDPTLASELVRAIVRGYQGDDRRDPERLLACAKHYAGYCETQGGRDASEADLTRRKLRTYLLPSFQAACEAGCATYMTGYQAIDGVPCTANRWLLTEVLRDEWGFEGFVVTDYDNVGRMHWQQHVCESIEEAGALAVEAGNDMMMVTPAFYDAAAQAVREGRLHEALLDTAVARILRLKFAMGLFDERRYTDMAARDVVVGCADHRAVALQAAAESLVLLKNDGGLLPLDGDALRHIAVIGPNADDAYAQFGDWALGVHDDDPDIVRQTVVTVLDGVRGGAADGCVVDYCRGCDVRDPADAAIDEAVRAAEGADVAVLVLGDDQTLNGEWRDRAVLTLTGAQQTTLEAVCATGTPVVLVLIHGRPLCIPWAAEHVPAILAAWNPGVEGGTAVADVLFGRRSPCGRLSISWPRHTGQLPVYYNQLPGWHAEKYADSTAEPQFAFGYGLTYTTFACKGLKLDAPQAAADGTLAAEVTVTNTGPVAGTTVVQLYTDDLVSSVTTPVKELRAFQRVTLGPGESQTVRLQVPCDALALWNADGERLVEPGEFGVMVGTSSRDEDLTRATFTVTA